MPVSEAQRRATRKYMKKAYDRAELLLPKGYKIVVREHAEQHGESFNAFVARAIAETMQRDKQKEGKV
jgi:hypothetical protein